MKKSAKLFWILALIMIIMFAVTACDEPNDDDDDDTYVGTEGLSFTLINNGTAYRVSGSSVKSSDVIIPASYKGLPVTNIDGFGFQGDNSTLNSITIPSSITTIEANAFYTCANLTSVTFASDSRLEIIGRQAFSDCTSLTSITIPESVTSIIEFAFSHCISITSITIPASVASVGQNAFSRWTSSQTIYVHWTEGNRPSGWNGSWLGGVGEKAQIVYLGQ